MAQPNIYQNNMGIPSQVLPLNPTDPAKYTPDEFDGEMLSTLHTEISEWEDAAVFVTNKEAYLMKKVIETARRYYSGIFEKQYDEVTGDKKTWVPMTETAVENVVKSIDLDTKDVLISPGKPSAVNIVPIIKAVILNLFKKIEFGQLLNDLTRVMATDGTVVVKTAIDKDQNTGKDKIVSYIVDNLNIYIDPSARSMQETAVIEKIPMSEEKIRHYDGEWDNIDAISYTNNVPKIGDVYNNSGTGIMPFTEVWERWGPMKKSWITKNHKDDQQWVEGRILASGLGHPQVIHYKEINKKKDGRKPYEECQFRRVHGRWYGRGVAEMLFSLQEYLNMIINTRKSNNMILQNGLFLIRKGSGITPDMLSSITAGGGLSVTNINNDIKQLQVQDFRQSSYTDEDRVQLAADRVTGAFDITRGEVGRASASATATLTRDRNIRDTFVLVQENLGFFIERLIRHQYIPLLQQMMKEGDFIKVTGEAADLTFLDEQIVNKRLDGFKSTYIAEHGFYPEDSAINDFIGKQQKFLKSQGRQRFVQYFRNMFDEEVDIEIHVTDEKFNRVVAVQQLRDMLIAYSRLPVASKLDTDAILREMFNIMGIKGEFFMERPALPVHALAASGPRPLKELPGGVPTELGASMNANGIQQQGPPGAPSPQAQPGGGLDSRLYINTGLAQLGQQPQQ